jgi:nicotinate-nucleotide adenylyltransferase
MHGPRSTSGAADSAPATPRRPHRVGILGGSFDPVHLGHLHAARAALDAFDLDRVVFVPAAQAPHKTDRPWADARDRMEMLRLAIQGEPRFEVSDIELCRGGVSFTIDTIRDLPRELGLPDDAEIYLIVGSDNLPGLPRWHRAQELLERVRPIVVHRAGDAEHMLSEMLAGLDAAAQAKLRAGYLRLPPVDVSSTEVRSNGARIDAERPQVPPAVQEYIHAHRLYGARS